VLIVVRKYFLNVFIFSSVLLVSNLEAAIIFNWKVGGYLERVVRGRYRILNPNDKFTNDKLTSIPGFGCGLGFKLSNYQIDYSFIPSNALGNTHRFSFTARF